jgi:hypothetical protein
MIVFLRTQVLIFGRRNKHVTPVNAGGIAWLLTPPQRVRRLSRVGQTADNATRRPPHAPHTHASHISPDWATPPPHTPKARPRKAAKGRRRAPSAGTAHPKSPRRQSQIHAGRHPQKSAAPEWQGGAPARAIGNNKPHISWRQAGPPPPPPHPHPVGPIAASNFRRRKKYAQYARGLRLDIETRVH